MTYRDLETYDQYLELLPLLYRLKLGLLLRQRNVGQLLVWEARHLMVTQMVVKMVMEAIKILITAVPQD